MVTIRNYSLYENEGGTKFVSLELIGDVELIQSQKTGSFYATVKKCYMASTFDEATAKLMIGRSIPGSIVKKQSDEYDYTMPETGEVIKLIHKYEYVP
jgi:hypothetical protein